MTGQQNAGGAPGWSFERLRTEVAALYPPEDLRLIERAYETAAGAHQGQHRRSGDPYITHPLTVAGIMVDADASAAAVCAALLHDVIDSSPYGMSRLRWEFGPRVAELVEGLHRRDALTQGDADREVVLLTLADRLHNIRTLQFLTRPRQRQVAHETIDVYLPLADRLDLPGLRRELTDLAAAALGWPEMRRRTQTGGQRLLAVGAMLLPAEVRFRWFEEWLGESTVLPTRRARARFAVQTLRGVPMLAATIRHRRRRSRMDTTSAAIGVGSGSIVLTVAAARAEIPVWAAFAVTLAASVASAAMFRRADAAARRAARRIRAHRAPQSH